MSPEQCRAARAWLEWSRKDLADRATVGVSTVQDFETGSRTPIQNNLAAIRQALESAGMIFIETGRTLGISGKTRGETPRAVTIGKAPTGRKRKTKGAKARR